MKTRPVKKFRCAIDVCRDSCCYDEAIDEFNEFIPDYAELTGLIIDALAESQKKEIVIFNGRLMGKRYKLSQMIAKAINERLQGTKK